MGVFQQSLQLKQFGALCLDLILLAEPALASIAAFQHSADLPQQQERVATSALKSPTAAPVDGSESYANGADPLAFASEVFVFAALVSCVASETAVNGSSALELLLLSARSLACPVPFVCEWLVSCLFDNLFALSSPDRCRICTGRWSLASALGMN